MKENITENLRRLRLNYLAENLDDFILGCDKSGTKGRDFIARIAELELVERAR